jgi:hypothetical protein
VVGFTAWGVKLVEGAEPAAGSPEIDVLAFPPDQAELRRRQALEMARWGELERRGRVALFFSIGMFLAWAADVGAAFELRGSGSAWFGLASVPIAIVVVLAHVSGRWALERAARGQAEMHRRYGDVTLREAAPLIELARNNAVVAQYLRCVGRQRRALRKLERAALHAWAQSAAPTSQKGR